MNYIIPSVGPLYLLEENTKEGGELITPTEETSTCSFCFVLTAIKGGHNILCYQFK